MTESVLSKQSKWWVLSLLTSLFHLVSCTATVKPPVVREIEPEAGVLKAELLKAELSSHEVVAGTLAVVKVSVPKSRTGEPIAGSFEGIELPFFPTPELGTGVFSAVLGVPYERNPGPGKIFIKLGEGSSASSLEIPFEIKEGDYPSEILKVDGRRVHPTQKRDLLRIHAEQIEIGKVYNRTTPKKYWNGPFALPIESPITSAFGTKRLYNGKLRNFHSGMDLKAAMNTPIYSGASGEVVLAKNLFYTGNTVIVDHGYGLITLYCHLNRIKVKVGQVIQHHQLVGLSGMTGRVNGPHLHWQAVAHHVKVNPLGLVQVLR